MHIKTSITQIKDGKEIIRGKKLEDLLKKHTFSETIFLIFSGRMPKKGEARVFDAMLTSAIDHGPAVASTLSARLSASAKNSTHTSLAAGILGFGDRHGIATESAMVFLKGLVDGGKNKQDIVEIVRKAREQKIRVPGYGHKVLDKDYRSLALFSVAKKEGVFGKHCNTALVLEKELFKQSSKPLPLNVDGAIAALLCDMGFDSSLGQAIFLTARVPGILAHIVEEKMQDVGLRRLGDDEVEFVG